MFQIGDEVYIEDSAQVDIGFMSWTFINKHRTARIKAQMTNAEMGVQEKAGIKYTLDYALEWPEAFTGGHNCHNTCNECCGQFVNEQHLSLNFENSRTVVTVPHI